MIALCIHRISHDPTARRTGGTHQRTLGWTAGGGVGVCRSDRCKPKWTYWVVWQQGRCTGRLNLLNLVRQIVEMTTRIDRRFLATSDPLSTTIRAKYVQRAKYPHSETTQLNNSWCPDQLELFVAANHSDSACTHIHYSSTCYHSQTVLWSTYSHQLPLCKTIHYEQDYTILYYKEDFMC